MSDFDQPNRAISTPRRAETKTPLQALTSLNHQFTLDMARFMTERVTSESTVNSEKIRHLYMLCFGRKPNEEELRQTIEFVESESLEALCRAMLNTSEMIYVR